MKAGRFTPGQALAIVPKICEALQFAHDEGVLHRDIKPENILLDAKGRVKLVDFGIAKLIGSTDLEAPPAAIDPGGALTQSGSSLGTPNYMAPEQILQPSRVDHRADIYSLGVVFYELLTGELPKEGFVPPSARSPVTPDVDAIVLRALEKERARRQQSASELKTEVEALVSNAVSNLGGAALAEPPMVATAATEAAADLPVRPVPKRRAWLHRLAATVLIALAIGIILATRPSGSFRDPPPPLQLTKVIELDRGWVQTNAGAVAVMSQSGIRPEESVVAGIRFPDGRFSPASSALFVLQRGKSRQSTLSFSWHFPEAFGWDHQTAAWDWIRSNHLHRPLRLVAGQPFQMFSITNNSGGTLHGSIEYRVVSDEELSSIQSNGPVRAMIRLKPRPAMPQWLTADFTVNVPAGYRVLGSCGGSAVNDGEANTHLYLGTSTLNPSCTWFVRGEFKPEHVRQGTEQLENLRSAGPIEITVSQPARLFSITNAFGETFDGYLELVGPGQAESSNVIIAPPLTPITRTATVSTTNDAGSNLPTVATMQDVAQRIGAGDAAAFDELQTISESLYRGIDYKTDQQRVLTNLALMSSSFEALGRGIAAGNEAAFDAVRRSLAVRHLSAFAPRALGIAAAAGHQESLDMLLNYADSKILLSSAVSALRPAAEKTNELAVQFLLRVLEDPSQRPLWHMASDGLRPAAAAGNVEAVTALKTYDQNRRR
jgi:hypothetical protein